MHNTATERARSPSRDADDEESASILRESLQDVHTPLLATDLPFEIVPDKAFRRLVMFMCCLFIGLVEIYGFLTSAPLQEIMEDFICHSAYPDHTMNNPMIQDQRCKGPEVQKTLAMARSWWVASLLVQMPLGIIADKYGRRPVIFLSLFGILLEGTLLITIRESLPAQSRFTFSQPISVLHPQTFTIWAVVWAPLAYLIGGGPPMAAAMVWTILCDTVPALERTTAFYHISALGIILSAILNPISAWLMSFDPWMPMWIGITCMALGTFAALLVPETLRLRKEADAAKRRDSSAAARLLPSEEQQSSDRPLPPKAYVSELLHGAKENTKHIWHFILASKSVMLLIGAIGVSYPIRLAAYYFTIAKVTGLIMLLIVLPIISKVLVRRLGDHALKKDLYLARGSSVCVMLACLLVATANDPPALVVSLVCYGIGLGYVSQVRALATGVVEPHTMATLNTMVSSTETLMGSIGAPAFGWLMSRGMDLGGFWLGLPFLAALAFAVGAALLVWLFRIPRAFR
ncbi:major facilitator superfamily protein [Sarocladium implicatum]|nr:major facilitator superfamily protein [Sarocladium implicatum]